jgi:Nitrate reductase gamma subunit
MGLPALPLRRLRRHRRARHRRPHPQSRTRAIGIPENVYRWFSAGAGTLAAVLVIGGIVVLASGRLLVPRVRATTSPIDYVALILLLLVILTGIAPTIGGQPARPRLQLPDHRRALVPRPVVRRRSR